MRKILLVLVAIFLMATSAYAWVETENGPQLKTSCWIKGVGSCTSGNVVILQTSSPTYPGREVTFTTTNGLKIYGIITDTTNYDANDLDSGKYVDVLTYGYETVVYEGNQTFSVGDALGTSTTRGRAAILADVQTTGGCVALEAGTVAVNVGQLVDCFLGN